MADFTTIKVTKKDGYIEAEFMHRYGYGKTEYSAVKSLREKIESEICSLLEVVDDLKCDTYYVGTECWYKD